MVAYSYQRQFIDPTLSGRKIHTIRALGKRRHARSGEALQHYVGMRTKQCRLFARSTCEDAKPIRIEFSERDDLTDKVTIGDTVITGQKLTPFAQSDGFAGWLEMRSFWLTTHGLGVFDGVIIYWKDVEPVT